MARKNKTVDLDRENDIAPGLVAKTKKRLVVAEGRSHPTLAADVASSLGHPARADRVPHLRLRGDPDPVRGVDPRVRLLPHPELRPARERVAHGDAHHAGRREARVGEADHRGRPVLPVLPPGQEEPRPRADQRTARRGPAQDRRCRPGHERRPARGADPGLLRRPGRPPVRQAGAAGVLRADAQPGGPQPSSPSSHPTPAACASPTPGRTASVRPSPSSTSAATRTSRTRSRSTRSSARSTAGCACWWTT